MSIGHLPFFVLVMFRLCVREVVNFLASLAYYHVTCVTDLTLRLQLDSGTLNGIYS